jgi:hypothetical protein
MSKSAKKEFYIFDDILENSYVIKNNVAYVLNGLYPEEWDKIDADIRVSISATGTFAIYAKDKESIINRPMDKLSKIIFDTEKKTIEIVGYRNKIEEYQVSETYEEPYFTEMCENIPVIFKEQNIRKFTKRKNGNRLILNFK